MLPGEKEDLKPRLTETDSLITIIENRMIQLEHTGTGQDIIRKPGKLLEKLSYLSYALPSPISGRPISITLFSGSCMNNG